MANKRKSLSPVISKILPKLSYFKDDGLESSPDVSNQSFPNYIEFLSTAQLNSSQLQAVEQCSNSKEPVTIIHGPPGEKIGINDLLGHTAVKAGSEYLFCFGQF